MGHFFVEYLDDKGNPTGQYAKRHEIPVEVEEEVEVLKEIEIADPETGQSMRVMRPFREKRIVKKIQYQDELIPKRRFCICDAMGNIKSASEIRFSWAIEEEGRPHCFELKDDEECHSIEDVDWDIHLSESKAHGCDDPLKCLVDHHKMSNKDAKGKRKLMKR